MSAEKIKIPVPVLQQPHWRVNFKPSVYNKSTIPTIARCIELVQQNAVQLRGWEYPYLSSKAEQRQLGNNWIASWSDFMGHMEYWRLYQSGQFIHLFSVYEAAPEHRKKLQSTAASHINRSDWDKVPGFIHIRNFLFTLTEIYEFASRLSEEGIYQDKVNISIELKNIEGFVLTTDWDRAWSNYYPATQAILAFKATYPATTLVYESAELALQTTIWFFERFGWLKPPLESFRSDQKLFLERRL
jgi:hypothetical protein